jgi:hypothetical protein
MRRPLVVMACLLLGTAALAADAGRDRPSTRLVYQRDAAAAACPDEARLRAEVARRVGSDPFDDGAAKTIVCRVAAVPRGLRASIEIGDAAGPHAARELVSQRTDCQDLAEAIAVALSIAMHPVISPPPPVDLMAAPTPTPTPAAAPSALAPPTPAPPEPARSDPPAPVPVIAAAGTARATAPVSAEHAHELRVSLAGGLAAGWSPGLAYGGDLAVGWAGRRYSAELGLRMVAPSSLAVGRGSLAVWQWAVLVAPCAHGRYLAGCLLGSAGVVYGSSQGLAITESASSPSFTAGVRGAAEVPLTGQRLRLRLQLDLAAALTRTHFTVGDAPAWTTPRATAVLGLGLVGIFF